MGKLEELKENLETLKNLLKKSGKITTSGTIRQNFCKSIGIDINDISPNNLDNLNDDIFIDELFNYLAVNTLACYELAVILENYFNSSFREVQQIRTIKRNLRLSEILTILEINDFTNGKIFDICNLAYKKCLLHKENKINIYSKNLDKDLNKSVEMLATLNNYQADEDNRFVLLDFFVGYLKININHNNQFVDFLKSLNQWIEYYQNNANELMNIINQQQEKQAIYTENEYVHSLFIAIKPGNNLTIDSWFIEDINTHPNDKNCRKINTNFSQELINDLTWNNLKHKFPVILDSLLDRIDSTQEIRNIQLFLPYQYIIPVDTFIITREEEEYYLGAYYQISVRLLERIKNATTIEDRDYQNRWIKKSRLLKNNIQNPNYSNLSDIFSPLDFLQKSSKALKNELRNENKLATRLTCVLENSKTIEFIKILYFTGIPLAIWLRENINNHEQYLRDIISSAQCLNTLSKSIKDARQKADETRDDNNHIGNHLYFLWDDADLVPHEEDFNYKLSIP